jgi:hypothetical protein
MVEGTVCLGKEATRGHLCSVPSSGHHLGKLGGDVEHAHVGVGVLVEGQGLHKVPAVAGEPLVEEALEKDRSSTLRKQSRLQAHAPSIATFGLTNTFGCAAFAHVCY